MTTRYTSIRRSGLGTCLVLASSACGGQDTVVLDAELDSDAVSLGTATFASSTTLPPCEREHQGRVYCVQREDSLYYCDGRRYRSLELDFDPSWLTRTAAAKRSMCANGGVVIHSGPDRNENGTLESNEVVTSGAVCNGEDGEDGAPGPRGLPGPRGAQGALGPKGESIQGPAGSSCSVTPGEGVYTIACDDETRVTLRDGVDGIAGQNGADGVDGTGGANGSVIALYPIAVGDVICSNGGVLVAVGVDDDRNGHLHASEEDAWNWVCNGAPGAAGAQGVPGAQGPEGPRGAAGGSCSEDDGPIDVDAGGIVRWQHSIADATVLVWPDGSLHLNGSQNADHVTELFAAPFYAASAATATGSRASRAGTSASLSQTSGVWE